ncbi:hypothetical protein L228DRAFT_246563 [Xylona heveae TC161]|uniref:Calcineurin-like phosphoesterase domain-containing protein n=1 Tax=Xylona heveae (strain CBS 132557 / TC161) TaxID=1328760 RepID=A0A165HM59_XYLHT|nr:hypothetical protein L228DRAFT_246563 [Xylona heveae TC161]KZF23721.1 hypothetical protein L228DRAFT_246563 [Xylona heveae TC161]
MQHLAATRSVASWRYKIQSLLPRPSVSFQVLSDLHLEINKQYSSYDIPVCSPYLILAGDVGRLADSDYNEYRDFLCRQTERFEKVFLVLGNHEFYGLSFAAGLEKAKQLEKEHCFSGRLVLLHQTRFDFDCNCSTSSSLVPPVSPSPLLSPYFSPRSCPCPRVTILGCTLWSQIPDDAKTRAIVKSKIKDFQNIHDWTIDDHNAAHESDVAWLRQQVGLIQRENEATPAHTKKRSGSSLGLESRFRSRSRSRPRNRSILIITHYAPSIAKTSSPRNSKNPWISAFATDLLSVSKRPNTQSEWDGVKVWVFGHTHHTTQFKQDGITVLSNQRGYVLPWKPDPRKRDSAEKDRVDVRKVVRLSG